MSRDVVVVHAPYHQPAHFDSLAAALSGTTTVHLPDLGLLPLADATEMVQDIVDVQSEPPVVLCHSFGGAIAGALDNVAGIVFLSAFVLDTNETAMSVLGPATAADPEGAAVFTDAVRQSAGGRIFSIDPAAAGALFYGDCRRADADRAVELLRPTLSANFVVPPSHAHWRNTPTLFVHTLRDRAWPAGLQESFAARCDSVVAIDSSHSPYISRPDEIADIIARVL